MMAELIKKSFMDKSRDEDADDDEVKETSDEEDGIEMEGDDSTEEEDDFKENTGFSEDN